MSSESERLNRILERHAPAVARCLSPLGREAAFPKGIPYQASMAAHTEINATIGQMTDGHGNALPLSVMEALVSDLDASMTFLYAPMEGHRSLRTAWRAREQRLAGTDRPVALPIATHGLTHGLSLVADLFGDPDATLVLPTPFWGNYRLLFQIHARMQIATWPFFDTFDDRASTVNVQALADCLERIPGKAIVVLNLPGNPTGYALSDAEARAVTEVIAAHPRPVVVVVDDAYQGFVYEPDRPARSLFWRLLDACDPERHVVLKVDGATKELLFFSSRLGFLTHGFTHPEAEEAVLSKLKFLLRGSVGSPPGPSQALVAKALDDPRLEQAFQERLAVMRARYEALRDALADAGTDAFFPYPFNAAFFMLLGLRGMDAETARLRLIEEESVGTISVKEPNALRLAHCSVDVAQIPELVARIARVVRSG